MLPSLYIIINPFSFRQMIQSMTGFGTAVLDLPNKKIRIDIKSLNSKQLDLNIRFPHLYMKMEKDVRQLLFQMIGRGKVEIVLTEIFDTNTFPKIRLSVFENYFHQMKNLMKKFEIPFSSEYIVAMFSFPGVIQRQIPVLVEEIGWEILSQVITKALHDFSDSRIREGFVLENIFRNKIQAIYSLLHDINKYEAERVEKIRIKLLNIFKKFQINNYDESRFEQELLYYIEKFDIYEEKSRLGYHLNFFLETMETGKNQGRKLGFIAQEIGREVNTLGSKSNHVEIQKRVVQMKDELEQMKEQILNVL